MVRIRFNVCIRTIEVLTGGKLIGIYILYLLSAIYFSVMTHLRQGKNVVILIISFNSISRNSSFEIRIQSSTHC
jgi:hypothetical protein